MGRIDSPRRERGELRERDRRQDQRHDHEPVQEEIADVERDDGERVGGEQAGVRRQVVAVAPEIGERRGPVRLAVGAQAGKHRLVTPALHPGHQPGADIAAAGDGREIVEPVQELTPRQALDRAEREGGAADAAPGEAERREIVERMRPREIGMEPRRVRGPVRRRTGWRRGAARPLAVRIGLDEDAAAEKNVLVFLEQRRQGVGGCSGRTLGPSAFEVLRRRDLLASTHRSSPHGDAPRRRRPVRQSEPAPRRREIISLRKLQPSTSCNREFQRKIPQYLAGRLPAPKMPLRNVKPCDALHGAPTDRAPAGTPSAAPIAGRNAQTR